MKKRILCVLLTLIMLISLVPATAITAAAASGAISESAITVLKQLEGYSTTCGGYGKTFGYGTVCTDKKCDGIHGEPEADTALRAELKELDKAVNSFATNKGLSLSQGQHDALVLFSFQNGTAWTVGTGDFQFAVVNRKTGADFLNAICYWHNSDNNDRRMIEANMYLYGKYASSVPDYFIQVKFDANSGTMTEKDTQYYDLNSSSAVNIVPAREGWKFLGWFDKTAGGTQIKNLTAKQDGETLHAMWQHESMNADNANTATHVNYTVKLSALASKDLYRIPSGKAADVYTKENLAKMMEAQKKDSIVIQKEYVDANGIRWGYISTEDFAYGTKYMRWVKLGTASFDASTGVGMSMDVTVTVTNSYVRSRSAASIYSAQNGTYYQGQNLRIINTANADGFVWGQVAKSADDITPVGWVALMYTNFDSVRNASGVQSTNVIATARITYNGYVNVRNGAGTDNQIVGALPYDLEVDLYETKYVNGIQWGRCNTGWFCLTYADVNRLVADTGYSSDIGFTSYAFTGDLKTATDVFTTVGGTEKAELKAEFDGKDVVITNLTDVSGDIWGKIAEGWVNVTGNVTLDVAKFYVITDGVTVRDAASNSAKRLNTLVKGVEFNVTKLAIAEDTIWGYADKVGEGTKTYAGWVNLSTKNVSRNGAPTVSNGNGDSYTGLIATVINTDSVRVREHGATYARVLGSLTNGTTAAVLAEQDGWYKLDIEVDNDPATDSWVSGSYLNVREGTISGTQNNTNSSTGTVTPETGKGVVANTYSGVNVRTGAGTAYAAINKLLPGTPVEILEVKTVGASKWGRIAEGWVCMDYIAMVDIYPVGGTTGSNTTTSSQVAIYTGTVTETINVRKTTSLDAEVVRQVKVGEPITLHELITVVIYEDKVISDTETSEGATVTTEKKTQYWARINDGYVYNPGKHLTLNALAEETYTLAKDVKDIPNLGEGEAKFTLKSGEQVKVTKLQVVKNYVEGYVECGKGEGWVAMTNMTKGFANTTKPEVEETPNTNTNTNTGNTGNTQAPVLGSTGNTTGGYADANGYKYTGKVINTNSVNVRAYASTGANITTTLKNGAALVVYETVISEGMAWGRCDAGWVYLYYVDLTPTVNGAVDARVVYNDNTIIYSDMNMGGTTGSTYAKMAVVDIYEIVGKMARTDLGWIHTDNLL